MDLATVRYLAHRAADAYVAPHLAPPGATILKDSSGQIRGYVTVDADQVVVAIAGTKSIRDGIIDAEILKEHISGGSVHWGFWQEYSSLRMAIARILLDHPDKRIRVCGHSLGGAIATLVAGQAALGGRPVDLVTLGSPRVGDGEFAVNLAKLPIDHVRIVHAYDVVPRVPKLGYQHVGQLLHLDGAGQVIGPVRRFFGRLWDWRCILLSDLNGVSLRDHEVIEYISSVEQYFTLSKGGDQ